MIRFTCSDCGRYMSAGDTHAGRRGKCPQCGGTVLVPQRSTVVAFHCDSCGHKIKVSAHHTGKKGRCPACGTTVTVPPLEEAPLADTLAVRVTCGICDQIIEIADPAGKTLIECPDCGSYVDASPEQTLSISPELGTPVSPSTIDDRCEEEPNTDEEAEDRNLRFILSLGATAVVVVTLIIIAVILRTPPSQPGDNESEVAQLSVERAQEVVEQYIDRLASGQTGETRELLSPELAASVEDSQIEDFASHIAYDSIIRVDCRQAWHENDSDESQALLLYNIHYRQGGQAVVVSVVQAGQEWRIDEIASRDHAGRAVSLGPTSFSGLHRRFSASTSKTRSPFAATFASAILVVLLVFALVQMAAWWIVYEKAGYSGWAAIVPFYNMWVLAEIGDKPGWLGLLLCFTCFIPMPVLGAIIAMILQTIIAIGVARAFDRGVLFGLGLSFVPIIFYPVLAFSRD